MSDFETRTCPSGASVSACAVPTPCTNPEASKADQANHATAETTTPSTSNELRHELTEKLKDLEVDRLAAQKNIETTKLNLEEAQSGFLNAPLTLLSGHQKALSEQLGTEQLHAKLLEAKARGYNNTLKLLDEVEKSASPELIAQLDKQLEKFPLNNQETYRNYIAALQSNNQTLAAVDETYRRQEVVVRTTRNVAIATGAAIATGGVLGGTYLAGATAGMGTVSTTATALATGTALGTTAGAIGNAVEATGHVALGNKTTDQAVGDALQQTSSDLRTAASGALNAAGGMAAAKGVGMVAGVVGSTTTNAVVQAAANNTAVIKVISGAAAGSAGALTSGVANTGLDVATGARPLDIAAISKDLVFDAGVGFLAGGLGGGASIIKEGKSALTFGATTTAEISGDLAIGYGSAALRAKLEGRELTFDEVTQEVASSILGTTIGEMGAQHGVAAAAAMRVNYELETSNLAALTLPLQKASTSEQLSPSTSQARPQHKKVQSAESNLIDRIIYTDRATFISEATHQATDLENQQLSASKSKLVVKEFGIAGQMTTDTISSALNKFNQLANKALELEFTDKQFVLKNSSELSKQELESILAKETFDGWYPSVQDQRDLNNNLAIKLVPFPVDFKTDSVDHFRLVPEVPTALTVAQGAAVIAKLNNSTTHLQTFGLGPCIAVFLYDQSTKTGALAHIDSPDKVRSFGSILSSFERSGINKNDLAVSIVGGSELNLNTHRAIKDFFSQSEMEIRQNTNSGDGWEEARALSLNLSTGEICCYDRSINDPEKTEALVNISRSSIFRDKLLIDDKIDTADSGNHRVQSADNLLIETSVESILHRLDAEENSFRQNSQSADILPEAQALVASIKRILSEYFEKAPTQVEQLQRTGEVLSANSKVLYLDSQEVVRERYAALRANELMTQHPLQQADAEGLARNEAAKISSYYDITSGKIIAPFPAHRLTNDGAKNSPGYEAAKEPRILAGSTLVHELNHQRKLNGVDASTLNRDERLRIETDAYVAQAEYLWKNGIEMRFEEARWHTTPRSENSRPAERSAIEAFVARHYPLTESKLFAAQENEVSPKTKLIIDNAIDVLSYVNELQSIDYFNQAAVEALTAAVAPTIKNLSELTNEEIKEIPQKAILNIVESVDSYIFLFPELNPEFDPDIDPTIVRRYPDMVPDPNVLLVKNFVHRLTNALEPDPVIAQWDTERQMEFHQNIKTDEPLKQIQTDYNTLLRELDSARRLKNRNFVESNKPVLESVAQRYASRVAEVFSDVYGIDAPEIIFFKDKQNASLGFIHGLDISAVYINSYFHTNLNDLHDTTVHELRHILQNWFAKRGTLSRYAALMYKDQASLDKRQMRVNFYPRGLSPESIEHLDYHCAVLRAASTFYSKAEDNWDLYNSNLLERDSDSAKEKIVTIKQDACNDLIQFLAVPTSRSYAIIAEALNLGVYEMDETTLVTKEAFSEVLNDPIVSQRFSLLADSTQKTIFEQVERNELTVDELALSLGGLDRIIFDRLSESPGFSEWFRWLTDSEKANVQQLAEEATYYSILNDELDLPPIVDPEENSSAFDFGFLSAGQITKSGAPLNEVFKDEDYYLELLNSLLTPDDVLNFATQHEPLEQTANDRPVATQILIELRRLQDTIEHDDFKFRPPTATSANSNLEALTEICLPDFSGPLKTLLSEQNLSDADLAPIVSAVYSKAARFGLTQPMQVLRSVNPELALQLTDEILLEGLGHIVRSNGNQEQLQKWLELHPESTALLKDPAVKQAAVSGLWTVNTAENLVSYLSTFELRGEDSVEMRRAIDQKIIKLCLGSDSLEIEALEHFRANGLITDECSIQLATIIASSAVKNLLPDGSEKRFLKSMSQIDALQLNEQNKLTATISALERYLKRHDCLSNANRATTVLGLNEASIEKGVRNAISSLANSLNYDSTQHASALAKTFNLDPSIIANTFIDAATSFNPTAANAFTKPDRLPHLSPEFNNTVYTSLNFASEGTLRSLITVLETGLELSRDVSTADSSPKTIADRIAHANTILKHNDIPIPIHYVHANNQHPSVLYLPKELVPVFHLGALAARRIVTTAKKQGVAIDDIFQQELAQLKQLDSAALSAELDKKIRGNGVYFQSLDTIVTPFFSRDNRDQMITSLSIYLHENQHAGGLGEGYAYWRQSQYQQRNGINPDFSLVGDIARHVKDCYSSESYQKAVSELLTISRESQLSATQRLSLLPHLKEVLQQEYAVELDRLYEQIISGEVTVRDAFSIYNFSDDTARNLRKQKSELLPSIVDLIKRDTPDLSANPLRRDTIESILRDSRHEHSKEVAAQYYTDIAEAYRQADLRDQAAGITWMQSLPEIEKLNQFQAEAGTAENQHQEKGLEESQSTAIKNVTPETMIVADFVNRPIAELQESVSNHQASLREKLNSNYKQFQGIGLSGQKAEQLQYILENHQTHDYSKGQLNVVTIPNIEGAHQSDMLFDGLVAMLSTVQGFATDPAFSYNRLEIEQPGGILVFNNSHYSSNEIYGHSSRPSSYDNRMSSRSFQDVSPDIWDNHFVGVIPHQQLFPEVEGLATLKLPEEKQNASLEEIQQLHEALQRRELLRQHATQIAIERLINLLEQEKGRIHAQLIEPINEIIKSDSLMLKSGYAIFTIVNNDEVRVNYAGTLDSESVSVYKRRANGETTEIQLRGEKQLHKEGHSVSFDLLVEQLRESAALGSEKRLRILSDDPA